MSPAMHGRAKVDRFALLRTTLEAAGVEFIESGDCEPGVRLRID